MVLESLVRTSEVKAHPDRMFLLSIFVAIVALVLSVGIFGVYSSVVWVALTAIALAPLMLNLFRKSEQEEVALHETPLTFMERQSFLISVYFWLFLGITIIASLAYIALPDGARTSLFGAQLDTLSQMAQLQSTVSGNMFAAGAANSFVHNFLFLFVHNFWILLLFFVTSLLYGMGALFITIWQASVLGTYVGVGGLETFSRKLQLDAVSQYGLGLYALAGILPHGILEIAGFFFAAISGAVLSAAIVNRVWKDKDAFKIVVEDTAVLFVIGVAFIFIAAIVESFAI